MSIGYPSVRVSSVTRLKYNIDADYKRGPIPRLIWNDGHGERSRAWYYFKNEDRVTGAGYYGLIK